MKITVCYWRGTTQHEGTATTFRGAMRIAFRNRNAFPARFYDPEGKELAVVHDCDGVPRGLAYADCSDPACVV